MLESTSESDTREFRILLRSKPRRLISRSLRFADGNYALRVYGMEEGWYVKIGPPGTRKTSCRKAWKWRRGSVQWDARNRAQFGKRRNSKAAVTEHDKPVAGRAGSGEDPSLKRPITECARRAPPRTRMVTLHSELYLRANTGSSPSWLPPLQIRLRPPPNLRSSRSVSTNIRPCNSRWQRHKVSSGQSSIFFASFAFFAVKDFASRLSRQIPLW